MKNEVEAALARRDLDGEFKKWRRLPNRVPKHGWICEIREALGMTAADLAQRMGVSQPAVAAMEASEAKGTLRLASLRRAAQAMDCFVIYALVPRYPLERVIESRRWQIAWNDLTKISGGKKGFGFGDLVKEYARKIKRRRVWRDLK